MLSPTGLKTAYGEAQDGTSAELSPRADVLSTLSTRPILFPLTGVT